MLVIKTCQKQVKCKKRKERERETETYSQIDSEQDMN